MLSRKNYNEKIRENTEKKNKYSIRKLSIGAVSALIGISFLGFSSHTVHAADQATATQTQTKTETDTSQSASGQTQTDATVTSQPVNTQTQPGTTSVSDSSTGDSNTEDPHKNTAPTDANTWQIGNDSKTYDGNEITKIDSKNFKLKGTDGQELNTTSVNNDSFEWVDQDGRPVSNKVPKDAGTYYVKLTDSAVKKLQQDNKSLTKDPGIVAKYTIKQAQGTATLRGYDSKAVDGKSVTTDDLNKDGKIYVALDIPGTTETKYQLQDGDYTWYSEDGQQTIAAPTAAGTYHVKLTQDGKNNITKEIDKLIGGGIETKDEKTNTTILENSNVKIAFIDDTTVNNVDSSINATFTIYDPSDKSKASSSPKGTAPKGAVWTAAGWTNSNPDYVAKSTTINLYSADKGSGKKNLESGNELKAFTTDIGNYNLFGANISATIDKNDLKIGNRILLAAITVTNDFTLDPDEQLKLSVASTENGRAVTDNNDQNIIGKISVTRLNNGEIDYWLDVTATDTYGRDVTIKDLKDYETGYINYATDFSQLANLKKDGKTLGITPRGTISDSKHISQLTQTISTASGTYTQIYKVGNGVGNGIKNVLDNATIWSSHSKPTMSGNYVNPALHSNKAALQAAAKNGTRIPQKDYYKVYFIQGSNLKFDDITTWERLEISPVGEDKQIKNESSDTVNNVKLDKNIKKAIRLEDNMSVKDLIAETPDGQSAYSKLKDDGAIVVVKVLPDDVKLSHDEITQYVNSSRYYNMQAKNRQAVLNNTINFYDQLGDQSLRTAVMIGLNLQDVNSNEGWGKISDITPDPSNKSDKIDELIVEGEHVRYQHGQANADTSVFRDAYINYYESANPGEQIATPDNRINNEVRTTLTEKEGDVATYSINVPLGYKLDSLKIGNNNIDLKTLGEDEDGNPTFTYKFHRNQTENKKEPINVFLVKIPQSHNVTYTVIDDDTNETNLTTKTQLPDVYMLDETGGSVFDKTKKSNEETANTALNNIIGEYVNPQKGYELVSNVNVDWSQLKKNNYNIEIHLKHGTTDVKADENNWPAGMDSSDETSLVKNVTRTISVDLPGKIISSVKQVAKFTRTAVVDKVSKKVIGYRVGSNDNIIDPSKADSAWELSQNDWNEYSVTQDITSDPSYTAGFYISEVKDAAGKNYSNVTKDGAGNITGVAAVSREQLNANTPDQNITIVYDAALQTMHIQYIDANDKTNVIKDYSVFGKLNQIIDTNATIPTGWKVADGQKDAPSQIYFSTTPTKDITTGIVHDTTKVPHDNPAKPGDKTSTGKDINGAHDKDLNQTITRTINVTTPDGKTTTTVQEAKIYRDATYDDVTGEVTYTDWSTDNWAEYNIPDVSGYTASQRKVDAEKVTAKTQPATVNITYTANNQRVTINFVDDDKNGSQVGDAITKNGVTDQTITDFSDVKVPDHYELANNQTLPTSYHFSADENQTITIHLTEKKILVDSNKPETNPDSDNENWFIEHDLQKSVTRTINDQVPSDTKIEIQQATIYRTATYNEVTGELTNLSDWSKASWSSYSVTDIPGYTTHVSQIVDGKTGEINSIDKIEVTDQTKPTIITITYTANDQTGKIIYQDVDNHNVEVGHTDLGGKTDETVTITPQAPTGFEIVPGQNIPISEKATADGIPTVTVKVKHHMITVIPGDEPQPGDKKSGNPDKKPGDGTPKTTVSYEDLHKAMNRTINVIDPHTDLKTTKDTLKYERTATIDDVTGDVTYGKWTVAQDSKSSFESFDIPTVAGYTSEVKSGSADELNAMTPSQDQITNWTDETIDIDYTANGQSMKITYVDDQGNSVAGGTFIVSGKTDQTVDTNAQIPTGWVLANGQKNAPKAITFSGTPTADIMIKIMHGMTNVTHDNSVNPGVKTPTGKDIDGAHESDLNQTITRTINVTTPDGKTKYEKQIAKIHRDATYDNVTGEVTYTDWSTDSWSDFKPATISGYTVSQADVPTVTVKDGQKDETVNITYTANDQTQVINYVDESGKKVSDKAIRGKTDETVAITPQAPDHYVIKPGQNIPKDVTLKDNNSPINIVVIPKMDQVTDPAQLNKTISRTITINEPGKQSTTISQSATFTRTGQTNEVTGETTFGEWRLKDNSLSEVDAPVVSGYKASQDKVDGIDAPTADAQLQDVTIDYTANDQSNTVVVIDDESNSQVGKTVEITGKTDTSTNWQVSIPDNYELVSGNNASGTYTFTAENKQITVHVHHKHEQVTDKKTITRTIIDNVPGEAPVTIEQTAHFTRIGDHDLASNTTSWQDWTSKDPNWSNYTAKGAKGYTPNTNEVKETVVSANDKDVEVNISYSANPQSNTVVVIDDDSNDKVIKSIQLNGKTGEKTDWEVTVPNNYELVSGGRSNDVSGDYTFTAENQTPIEVHVHHKHAQNSESKSVTRTIIVNVPGSEKSETQTVNFTRTVDTDAVTGKKTNSEWKADSNGKWEEFTAPTIKGYTPDKTSVAEETVDVNTGNQVITINYKENLADVNFDGNASSDYGQPLNISNLQNKLSLTNGEYHLSDNDLDWYQDGVKLDKAPENAGTYTVRLKNDVLKALHAKDDNFHFNFDKNSVDYIINKVDLAVKLTGHSTQQKSTNYDLDDYAIQFGSESHKLSDLNLDQNDLIFVRDANDTSHYSISLNKSAQDKLQKLYANYKVKFANDATLDLKNTHEVQYVDENGNVVDSDNFDGKDQEFQNFMPHFPHGWILMDMDIPSKIQINGGITKIRIKHAKTTVKADDPKTSDDVLPHNTDVHYPSGVNKDDLNKNVTRKIIVHLPDGQVKTIVQTAKFSRDAEVDEVTGEVNYLDWLLAENGLSEYQAPKIDGFHASLEKVAGETPKADSQYEDIEINYVADPKSDDQTEDTDTKTTPTDEPQQETKADSDDTNSDSPEYVIDDQIIDSDQQADHQKRDEAFEAALGKKVKGTNKHSKKHETKRKAKVEKAKVATKKNNKTEKHTAVNNQKSVSTTDNKIKPAETVAHTNYDEVKNNGNVSAKAQTATKAKNTLPETGSKDTQSASWLGILLSTLGLSALFVNRKKKKD